jgi:nitrate reductase gamma subunit
LAHALVFGSWLVLGLLSTATGFVVEILPLLGLSPYQIASIPLLGHLFHADVWWVALLNELLGLLVVVGMAMMIYRRYGRPDPQLRTERNDTVVFVLLAFIAVSGFPTESLRLLADYTTPAGLFAPDPSMLSPERYPPRLLAVWGPQWGFVGYFLARVLGSLELAPTIWQVVHNLFFWLHFASVSALLFLLPFSRFAHVVLSPVVVALNTFRERERQSSHRPELVT